MLLVCKILLTYLDVPTVCLHMTSHTVISNNVQVSAGEVSAVMNV